jgi:CheY-like chemotaxis protein
MRKRILLADDSITIQKVVELTFSDGDYEVVAVNNGAKAIQKIAEMKPDVILSDIIMPEKNGYEVCEFVKSHPVYRGIPVILLTGTFEPFDPDRADKAGCDAVVTKPFESQSLIQKVEELIEQSQAGRPPEAAPAAEPEPTPWAEPAAPAAPEPDAQFATARAFTSPAFPDTPEPEEPAEPSDFFKSAAAPAPPTAELPYAGSPSSGETRAFPRLNFEEPAAAPPESPSDSEPTPWNQTPAGGGETRAFPKMTFDDLPRPPSPVEMPAPASKDASPWDEAPLAGGDTNSFPQMSFNDLERSESTPPAAPEMPEPSPWDEAPAGGETRSFGKMSFDDLRQASTPEPAPSAPEPSPWESSDSGGETRSFPRKTFDGVPPASHAPAAEAPSAWDAPAPSTPSWGAAPDTNIDEPSMPESFSKPSPALFGSAPERESFFGETPQQPAAEPAWSSKASEPVAPTPAAASSSGSDLTEEQIDRIARRVVQMLSDQVVRNIAWEVIPDLAEMVVKERIRQLESEP